jgi:serine phosphatase RsbU (regulator of sigma subunit)
MHTARDVQAHLLPAPALRLGTLACYGRSVAARGIGGDIYDFLHTADGRITLALGDISGKGVSAALMMASLQACLRSQYAAGPRELRSLLRSVNRLHHDCTAPQHYASLFLGEYDDRSRSLRYANCGHNPGLLVRGDSTVERLGATATVLGMFRTWDCAVSRVLLFPGDTLLLFTDGATEATNPSGETFGEARLLETLQCRRDASLPLLVDSMLREIRSFTRGRPTDDVTIVVARALPRGGKRLASARTGRRRGIDR